MQQSLKPEWQSVTVKSTERFNQARASLRRAEMAESLAALMMTMGGEDQDISDYYGHPDAQAGILKERAERRTLTTVDEAA